MTDSEASLVVEGPGSSRMLFSRSWEGYAVIKSYRRQVVVTNTSTAGAEVHKGDDYPLPLPVGGILGIDMPVDGIRIQSLSPDALARGDWVTYDNMFNWQIPNPTQTVSVPRQGPIELALVVSPESDFVVEWLADGKVRRQVGPGEIASLSFTEQEARTMALRAEPMDAPPAKWRAFGLFCSGGS